MTTLRRNPRFAILPVATFLIFTMAWPSVSIAQENGEDSSSDSSISEPPGTGFDPTLVFQGDGPIVDRIDRIGEVCSAVPLQNRIHCLAYQYEALASQIPGTAEYHDMRIAILQAARNLRRLAAENLDPEAPMARVPRVADRVPPVARRQVPAVRRDTLAETTRAAEAILEETATVLLRSAESTRNRSVAYQRVAEAIDSSKVLLRST
jgi:hypothetical protein